MRIIIYALTFLVAFVAGFGLSLQGAEAASDERHANRSEDGYFMHLWLTWEQGSLDRTYRYGMDSRASWGGSPKAMAQFRMQPARAWKCGNLAYRYVATYFGIHYLTTSKVVGWPNCDPQADIQARFYQSAPLVDWWPYLNF